MVSVAAIVTPRLLACGTTTMAPVTPFVVIEATILVGFVASQPNALVPLSTEVRFML